MIGDNVSTYKGKPCKIGHEGIRLLSNKQCVECRKLEYEKNKKKYSKNRKTKHRQQPRKAMFKSARDRAKKFSLAFNIVESDIKIPSVCPVLGIRLYIGDRTRTDNSPTLDRISNSRGYTKDNVIVVSWKANRIKNDATISELKRITRFYSNLEKQNGKRPNSKRQGLVPLLEKEVQPSLPHMSYVYSTTRH